MQAKFDNASQRLDQRLEERIKDFKECIANKKREISEKDVYQRNPRILELAHKCFDEQLEKYIEEATASTIKFQQRLNYE